MKLDFNEIMKKMDFGHTVAATTLRMLEETFNCGDIASFQYILADTVMSLAEPSSLAQVRAETVIGVFVETGISSVYSAPPSEHDEVRYYMLHCNDENDPYRLISYTSTSTDCEIITNNGHIGPGVAFGHRLGEIRKLEHLATECNVFINATGTVCKKPAMTGDNDSILDTSISDGDFHDDGVLVTDEPTVEQVESVEEDEDPRHPTNDKLVDKILTAIPSLKLSESHETFLRHQCFDRNNIIFIVAHALMTKTPRNLSQGMHEIYECMRSYDLRYVYGFLDRQLMSLRVVHVHGGYYLVSCVDDTWAVMSAEGVALSEDSLVYREALAIAKEEQETYGQHAEYSITFDINDLLVASEMNDIVAEVVPTTDDVDQPKPIEDAELLDAVLSSTSGLELFERYTDFLNKRHYNIKNVVYVILHSLVNNPTTGMSWCLDCLHVTMRTCGFPFVYGSFGGRSIVLHVVYLCNNCYIAMCTHGVWTVVTAEGEVLPKDSLMYREAIILAKDEQCYIDDRSVCHVAFDNADLTVALGKTAYDSVANTTDAMTKEKFISMIHAAKFDAEDWEEIIDELKDKVKPVIEEAARYHMEANRHWESYLDTISGLD